MIAIVQSEMYLDTSDAEKNLDAVIILTCGYLAVSKILQFRIRPAGLISNFTSAVKDYNELNDQEKRVIVRRHAYMGRVAGISVVLFSHFSATLFTALPMLAGEQVKDIVNVTEESIPEYPMPSEKVIALVKIPDNFYLIVFIVEYLMLLSTSNGNIGNESSCHTNCSLSGAMPINSTI
uniref:uncharacterized protein LOC117166292 n=1 Tax=Bombus vancouverensis nearcticus TaxID=2705178 RepID=UPI00143BB905|nr:uncharacterized protein LOC117166292 [Bombus vancouverensis nearcticus]